jgi:transposase
MEKDMGNQQYTDEFKEEAVRQVLGRGYSVKEVSENLGVSTYSLYKWLQKARPKPDQKKDDELLEAKRENMKLRAALRRVEEERDILKKAAAYFARVPE